MSTEKGNSQKKYIESWNKHESEVEVVLSELEKAIKEAAVDSSTRSQARLFKMAYANLYKTHEFLKSANNKGKK